MMLSSALMEGKKELQIFPIQPTPNEPLTFLKEIARKLNCPDDPQKWRENEKILSLVSLVLLVDLDSETPFHKFLEGQPCQVNIDKLSRKRYVISGSIRSFRELYLELKEQKVSKALLIFLCQNFPELFEDLWPKHGLVPPVGIHFRTLTTQELKALELPLQMRHYYLLSRFSLELIDLLDFCELEIRPTILVKDSSWAQGFLYLPLIQYMALLSRFLGTEHPLKGLVRNLLQELKKCFPEPFGLLPDLSF